MMPLKEHYKTNVVSELKGKLGLESIMAVPKVTKVTLNMGVGEAMNDKKLLERAVEDMTLIAVARSHLVVTECMNFWTG